MSISDENILLVVKLLIIIELTEGLDIAFILEAIGDVPNRDALAPHRSDKAAAQLKLLGEADRVS